MKKFNASLIRDVSQTQCCDISKNLGAVAVGALTIVMLVSTATTALASHRNSRSREIHHITEASLILAGTGCSTDDDSLSAIDTQEGTVIAIGFSRMESRGSGRKSCVLRAPITIPAGYRVVVSGGEADGYAELDGGDSLGVASTLSVLGSFSPVETKQFYGPDGVTFGPSGSGTVFQSPHRISSQCMTESTEGFLGLNIVSSMSSPSRAGQVTILDVAIGVRIIPCH